MVGTNFNTRKIAYFLPHLECLVTTFAGIKKDAHATIRLHHPTVCGLGFCNPVFHFISKSLMRSLFEGTIYPPPVV